MDDSHIKTAADWIKKSEFIVALTGAGISTNAGIPDFRGKSGIYTTGKYPPDVFDIVKFATDPVVFFKYAGDYLETESKLIPTFTHRLLADMEQSGKLKCVVTQNIDCLHHRAGSRNIIEVHGSFYTSRCLDCARVYDYKTLKEKICDTVVPRCDGCNGIIKPDIVFFGEPVNGMEEAARIISSSDLLLIIGTSLTVYPAALLPNAARGKIIAVNNKPVPLPGHNALMVESDIDEFFRQAMRQCG